MESVREGEMESPLPLPRSPAPLLEVSGLSTGYGGVQVLWGVDLAVGPGESVALIGANGAGKTTLLRALAGLLPSWQGSVRFGGRELGATPPHRRVGTGMVMVPEGRQLFARLVSLCNDLGLLAEEYDPVQQRQVGNFPQAFSHIALVNTAHNLTRLARPVDQRAGVAAVTT